VLSTPLDVPNGAASALKSVIVRERQREVRQTESLGRLEERRSTLGDAFERRMMIDECHSAMAQAVKMANNRLHSLSPVNTDVGHSRGTVLNAGNNYGDVQRAKLGEQMFVKLGNQRGQPGHAASKKHLQLARQSVAFVAGVSAQQFVAIRARH